MGRRKLNRFPVDEPSADALARYYRKFTSGQLWNEPETVPDVTSEGFFHNSKPLEIDIGCGRGEFSLALATDNPGTNYLGVDYHLKSLYDAVNNASRADVDNLLYVKADMRLFQQKFVDDAVHAFYLMFPPPRVERKRRDQDFITGEFVDLLYNTLQSGGRLVLATDHHEYFNAKRALFEKTALTVRLYSERLETDELSEGKVRGNITWFQSVWERHGLETYRVESEK